MSELPIWVLTSCCSAERFVGRRLTYTNYTRETEKPTTLVTRLVLRLSSQETHLKGGRVVRVDREQALHFVGAIGGADGHQRLAARLTKQPREHHKNRLRSLRAQQRRRAVGCRQRLRKKKEK